MWRFSPHYEVDIFWSFHGATPRRVTTKNLCQSHGGCWFFMQWVFSQGCGRLVGRSSVWPTPVERKIVGFSQEKQSYNLESCESARTRGWVRFLCSEPFKSNRPFILNLILAVWQNIEYFWPYANIWIGLDERKCLDGRDRPRDGQQAGQIRIGLKLRGEMNYRVCLADDSAVKYGESNSSCWEQNAT